MTITPILAHGGGLLPLLGAWGLALDLLVVGVFFIAAGKKRSHAMVGFVLCLTSIVIVVLSVEFFDKLIHLLIWHE